MREHRLALTTAAATFALLVIGGLVHATGSSLACPDWPLCGGQVFPAMQGGVLFEHGHRLVALAVAVLTVWTAVEVLRTRKQIAERRLVVLAVALVIVQAGLGALTVILRLPLIVSAGHLATSMAFFLVMVILAFRLRPPPMPERGEPLPERGPRALVMLLVYVQIVLGALVRHTGSAMACGTHLVLCGDVLVPSSGPGQLQMIHRLFAVLAGVAVVATAWRPMRVARRNGDWPLYWVAAAAPGLVVVQIFLGMLTVATFVSIPVATLHLAVGALLLADVMSLHLLLARHLRPTRPGGVAISSQLAPSAG
jgi:heme A synthase